MKEEVQHDMEGELSCRAAFLFCISFFAKFVARIFIICVKVRWILIV